MGVPSEIDARLAAGDRVSGGGANVGWSGKVGIVAGDDVSEGKGVGGWVGITTITARGVCVGTKVDNRTGEANGSSTCAGRTEVGWQAAAKVSIIKIKIRFITAFIVQSGGWRSTCALILSD